MSREIKFRAWEKNLKEMIPVYNIDLITGTINTMSAWRFISEIEIMQYTGLKDKNGKEVYEGDIVTAWSQGSFGKFQIKWREDGGGSPMWLLYPAFQGGVIWGISASRETDGQVYDRGLEVIGNIYSNPELLQEVNKC